MSAEEYKPINFYDSLRNKDVIQMYRNTFLTPQGRQCLFHMLWGLNYFNDDVDIDDRKAALKAFGTTLIKVISGNDEDVLMEAMMEAMMESIKKASVE